MPNLRRTKPPLARSLHVARPTRRTRSRTVALGVSTAVALSLTPGLTGTAAGARAVPNLVVTSASVDRSTIAEGAVLRVTHVVRNSGTAKTGASETRFYLSTDVAASKAARKASRTNPRSSPLDIRLDGGAPVKALGAGRSATVRTVKVTVPVGTAAGSYRVLACADDRGKVKEKNEADNCTVAAKALKVKPAAGSDSLVLQQFADSDRWPADEDFNVKMIKLFCEVLYEPERMSLKNALASATGFLEEKVGNGALDKLEGSGQADTAVEAQQLAAAAVAKNTPGLALASLMRAHGLEPGNGTHLVNAAAMATSVGLPNEAIAFLDAAQLRDMHRPAFGVSQHAIALTVRGQAMVMTGRSDQAEDLFLAAKAAEPLLSEADAGLATIAACKGQDDIAAKYIRKSRQRSQKKDKTKPTEAVERPDPNIDLTFGETTTMRTFPHAETPAQGVKMRPEYQLLGDALDEAFFANGDEMDAIDQHLRETDELRTRAEIDRRNDIQLMAVDVLDDPAVRGPYDTALDRMEDIDEIMADFWGSGTTQEHFAVLDLSAEAADVCLGGIEDFDVCYMREMNARCRPALTAAHTQWRGLMGQMETALRQHVEAHSQRVSALAANLEDEEAHRSMLLSIKGHEMAVYGHLVQHAEMWTRYEVMYEAKCVAPAPAQVVEPGTPEEVNSSGPCPKHIAAMNWVALLGPTKVKVTCEKVTQEISAEVLPLLHAFAEVSYEYRTGRVTIFAGSKGEGKLGVVEAGFKSGIYLTSDGRGNIDDVGWRVGPSVSVAEGAAEFQAVEDMVDLSFLPETKTEP